MNNDKQYLDNPIFQKLFEEIKHGDEEHQKWLFEKMNAFYELHFDSDSISEHCQMARKLILQLLPPAEYGESYEAEQLYDITGVIELNLCEYAQQEAMAFAEWIANNYYEWSHRAVNPRLWSRGFDEDLAFTTEELWELFNKK